MNPSLASRLSEEKVRQRLDAGVLALPKAGKSPEITAITTIDFSSILSGPSAPSKIQALDVQTLFTSIKVRGIDECLDVLPLLSREQFLRILDYDAWHTGALVPEKAYVWLSAYGSISSQALFARFSSLDEEYQLALLQGRLEVFQHEDGLDGIDSSVHDELTAMPCNQVFYRVLSENKDEIEFVHSLIAAALEHNLPYAYSLINFAHASPPGEAVALLTQFRNARLEEDGFIPYQESLAIFIPTPIDSVFVKRMIHEALTEEEGLSKTSPLKSSILLKALEEGFAAPMSVDERKSFEDQCQSIRYLSNALCASAQLEVDNILGLRFLLQNAQAMVSLGMEYVQESQMKESSALEVFSSRTAKEFFRIALGVVNELRIEMLSLLENFGLDVSKPQQLLKQYKFGALLDYIDRHWADKFDLLAMEELRGLFNRFPSEAKFIQDKNSKSDDPSVAHRVIFIPLASLGDLNKMYQRMSLYLKEVKLRSKENSTHSPRGMQ